MTHLVCSDGFAGVERYLANVATGLTRDGVEVTVIGGDRRQMTSALASTGVRWMPGDDMREAMRTLRATAAPDVLHTHMSQADLVGWLYRRAPRARRVRQVSTRHFAGPRGRSPLSRAAFRPVGRSLAAQIAISQFVAENVEPPAEVVYSGVDSTDAARPREPFVLAAQRLEPEKHTADVIDAWAQSRGPLDGWTLKIAGDGAERADLEKRAKERGVGDSVEFLGHRPDVPDLLARASMVIAPTRREGLGILVLEAMAHGTPVVASAGGGHLETVGVATPELLFPSGDTAYAARVMDSLIADDGLRARAGEAARAAQRGRFTLDAQVRGIRAVYDRLGVGE
ncbi:glycosyltransferase family 4 protein [Microbacterium sp. NPDC055910]|uniref:glycosyltransferase family 4 protein n=1 Tax=Microbacterium sp. NPDC055910 TaxID=3345659 RepID=UPI0035E2962B